MSAGKKMIGRTTRAGIVLLVIVFLSSCLGLEVETKFNADGSGTLLMKLTISKSVLDLGEDSGGETGLNIPMSREDVEAEFSNIEGAELVSVTQEDTEEDIVISAVIKFDSLDVLTKAEDSPVEFAALRKEGDRTIYDVTIGEARQMATKAEDSPFKDAEMDDAMKAMVQAFLEGYFLEYRVVAPKKIVRYTHGEIDSTGRVVTYRIPMAESFLVDEPYTFEVEW